MIQLVKVISGGQTGVDQVALAVARALGYQTGGTAPKDWRTDDGPNPDLLRGYGLVESYFAGYRMRTIENVHAADATIWFGDVASPGGQLTRKAAISWQARTLGYLWFSNPDAEILRAMLSTHPIAVLNVAGNRYRINPAAADLAKITLYEALAR